MPTTLLTAKEILTKLRLPLEDYPTSAAVFDIINMESKQRHELQRSNLNKLIETNRWIEIAAIYANKQEIPAKFIKPELYRPITESCRKLQDDAQKEMLSVIAFLSNGDIVKTNIEIMKNIAQCWHNINEINLNEKNIAAKLKKIKDEYIKIVNYKKDMPHIDATEIREIDPSAYSDVLSKVTAHISAPLDHVAFANEWHHLQKQRSLRHYFGKFFIALRPGYKENIKLIQKVNENIRQYNAASSQITTITLASESAQFFQSLRTLDKDLVTTIKELGKNAGYEFNIEEDGTVLLNKVNGTNTIPLYVVNNLASLEKYIKTRAIDNDGIICLFKEYLKSKNFVNIPQVAFDLVLLLTSQNQNQEEISHYQQMLCNEAQESDDNKTLDELLVYLFRTAIHMRKIDEITKLYIFTHSIAGEIVELNIKYIEQEIMKHTLLCANDSEESRLFVWQLIDLLHANTTRELQKISQYEENEATIDQLIKNKHYIALALVTSDLSIIPKDKIADIDSASINKTNKNLIMQLAKMSLWQDYTEITRPGDDYAAKTPELAAAITSLRKLFEKASNEVFPDTSLNQIETIDAYRDICIKIITQTRNVKHTLINAANIGADQAGDKESHETETKTEHLTETLTPQQKRNNFLSAQQALTVEQRIPHTTDELVAALTDNKMHQEITDEIYAQTILFLQKYVAEKPEITTVIARLQAETQINTFNIMCLLHAVYPNDMKLKKLFVKICRTEDVKNIEQEIQRLSDTENKTAAQEEELATIIKFKKLFSPTTSEIYTFIKLLHTGKDIKPASQAKYLKINAETNLDRHKEWLFAQTEQQLSEQIQRQKHNANAEAANIEHILWVIFAEKNKYGKEVLIKEINEILFIQPTDIDLAIASALVFDPKATALLSMIDAMDAEAIDSALQKWETLRAQINTTIQNILQNKLALKQDAIASTHKLQAMYQEKLTEFDIYQAQQSSHLDALEQDIAALSRILGHEKKLSLTRPQITIATPNFAAAAAEHPVTALSTPENIKAMGEHIASLDTDILQIQADDDSMAELTKNTEQEILAYKTACADYIAKLQDFKTKITDSFVSKNPESKLNSRLKDALQHNASLTTAHQRQEIQMGEMEENIRKLEEQMAGNIKKLRADLATSAKEAAAKAAQIKEIEENVAKLKAYLATSINESAAKTAIIDQLKRRIAVLKIDIAAQENLYIKLKYFSQLKSHANSSKSHRATNDVTKQLAPAAPAALFQPIKYRQLIEYNYLQKNICTWFANILDGILADRATSHDKNHVDHLTMFKMGMQRRTAACITILPDYYNSEFKDEETRMRNFADRLLELMYKAVRGLTLHKEAYSYINEIFAAEANVLANLSRELAKNLCRPQQTTAAAPEPAKHNP